VNTRRSFSLWLFAGDTLAILVVSVIGFLTHNVELNWRVLTTFLPYLAAWGMIAPWLGVYQQEMTRQPRFIWRPALAAFLAAPMAAWLRGVWLNQPILPVFVLVLGLSAALGFLVWRLLGTVIVKYANNNG
jgi:hypothetical protein